MTKKEPFEWRESGAGAFPASMKANFGEHGVRITLRDHAHVEHSENGAHFAAGHETTVVVPMEAILDFASKAIMADMIDKFDKSEPKPLLGFEVVVGQPEGTTVVPFLRDSDLALPLGPHGDEETGGC